MKFCPKTLQCEKTKDILARCFWYILLISPDTVQRYAFRHCYRTSKRRVRRVSMGKCIHQLEWMKVLQNRIVFHHIVIFCYCNSMIVFFLSSIHKIIICCFRGWLLITHNQPRKQKMMMCMKSYRNIRFLLYQTSTCSRKGTYRDITKLLRYRQGCTM